jgi:hypothetical protein
MGFFNIFGGSEDRTAVHTTTNTSINDIGLTGQNAVDLASVVEIGSIQRDQIRGGVMETIFLGASDMYQSLLGGASKTLQDANQVYLEASKQRERMAESMVTERLSMVRSATGERIQVDKVLPIVIVGGFALMGLAMWNK